jgi:hypothetical protein
MLDQDGEQGPLGLQPGPMDMGLDGVGKVRVLGARSKLTWEWIPTVTVRSCCLIGSRATVAWVSSMVGTKVSAVMPPYWRHPNP